MSAPNPHWVLHVDLDQFLAAVEVRRRPDLDGLPVVVGGNGDPDEPRKVVACASYAARARGVHAGMPLRAAARRCPDAVFLPTDNAVYDAASEEVMGLLRDLGHPVEVWGWDEAYLAADTDDPAQLAHRIRALVAAETGLSCSVGISDNKQRAKVATGFGKPQFVAAGPRPRGTTPLAEPGGSVAAGPRPRGTTPLAEPGGGVFTLTDANWMDTMGDRSVESLWGVGPRTTKKLGALDITTVRELASSDAELLVSTFGPRTGLWLLLLAKGGGDTEVSAAPWVPRSHSHVVTFPADLTDRDEMNSAVTELALRTLADVRSEHRVVNRVAVTVRTATFYTRTRARKLEAPTTDPAPITAAALDLLGKFEPGRPVRLLGVRLELVMPD